MHIQTIVFDLGGVLIELRKPDVAIFRLMLERFKLDAGQTIYIDDVEANIVAARQVGLRAIHFLSAGELRKTLHDLGLVQRHKL